MISFFICLFLLIGGFFVYGKFAEKVFGPDDRRTPAIAMEDGADYVPMGTARIFLIQLLNIAGLGPIFGALAGAAWGILMDYPGNHSGRRRSRLHDRHDVHAPQGSQRV